jgi:uncharacterized protein YecE (DUF72 family)
MAHRFFCGQDTRRNLRVETIFAAQVTKPTNRAIPRVGISGWRYGGWRGKFYPKGLAQRRELEYASGLFNSIEINGSFYSLQRPSSYQRWYAETPENFLFSVKGARYITHMKRLREVRAPLANFFASGLLALREKLGPILWQFPPQFQWSEEKSSNSSACCRAIPRKRPRSPGNMMTS